MTRLRRRELLGAGAAATAAAALGGCSPPREIAGGFFPGTNVERGHLLRAQAPIGAATTTRRAHVVIAGGGVAGLATARALRLAGIDDFALLELEDAPGGNSRGGMVGGIACPLGAHYLPLPGNAATEVQDLLEELGLRRRVAGRWQYDERHLCHSPQERLFFRGEWQDGLLPLHGVGPETLAEYRRFALAVDALRRAAPFTIPVSKMPLAPVQQALDAIVFDSWLNREGFTDAQLRWFLDYCCRDDFGTGTAHVSAWAGIHYFASRHGFAAPGLDEDAGHDAVLTWPQGNGWLVERLAAPLGECFQTGRVVLRIDGTGKDGVTVDAFDASTQQVERWHAAHCIVCLPLLAAARVVLNAPPALTAAAAQLRYAPWLVSNIHLAAALDDRPGAAPSWDNVIHGSRALGYVDATHQRLQQRAPGAATVLTHYHALLGDTPDPAAARRALLERPWTHWRDFVLADLGVPHPDLRAKTTRIECTRWGHAMSIPVPGVRSSAALAALRRPEPRTRLQFAHGDLSGYSIFEEAFTHGHRAGLMAAGRSSGA